MIAAGNQVGYWEECASVGCLHTVPNPHLEAVSHTCPTLVVSRGARVDQISAQYTVLSLSITLAQLVESVKDMF